MPLVTNQDYTLASVRLELLDINLRVKAIIMDMNSFRGAIVELETLNQAGREKLVALRKCIERLEDLAYDEGNSDILKEMEKHREQLYSLQQAFRMANIATKLEIEEANKEELFELRSKACGIRKRTTAGSKANRGSALLMQHGAITDQMHSISEQLVELTQKSAATLDRLVATSATVQGTGVELLKTGDTIKRSKILPEKNGRRECTDKILALFGLTLFLVCVIYVIASFEGSLHECTKLVGHRGVGEQDRSRFTCQCDTI